MALIPSEIQNLLDLTLNLSFWICTVNIAVKLAPLQPQDLKIVLVKTANAHIFFNH